MSVHASLIPELVPFAQSLLEVARQYDPGARIISATRSYSEQAALYDRYQRGGRIPAAAPGRSLHNYGHAFDLVTSDRELQQWLGEVWEWWGGRWGGRFDDPNHFDTGASIEG